MMELAINKAKETMNQNMGGPFGCVILDKDNNVLAITSNTVLKDNDPTAHGEINAIREASKKLGTYDLSGCTLYTTSYPCPMCLGAIIWSNIKKVYYGTSLEDAERIGFRDDFIYEYLKGNNVGILNIEQIDRGACLQLFNEYQRKDKIIY